MALYIFFLLERRPPILASNKTFFLVFFCSVLGQGDDGGLFGQPGILLVLKPAIGQAGMPTIKQQQQQQQQQKQQHKDINIITSSNNK